MIIKLLNKYVKNIILAMRNKRGEFIYELCVRLTDHKSIDNVRQF
jgi:hypothetical protein